MYADIHVDMQRFGHKLPLVPNPGEVRFELRIRVQSGWIHRRDSRPHVRLLALGAAFFSYPVLWDLVQLTK